MHYTVALSSAQVNVNAAAQQPLAQEPVVKNDTGTSGIPSIKLDAISAPSEVHASDAGPTAMGKLKSMEASRRSWETAELAASNKRLYSILRSAYSYYAVMKTDDKKEVRQEHADTLTKFIKEREYKFTNSTHDMTRVVKCVFGTDRRRVSAYSIALREALRQEIAVDDLVTFIEENGGVEQIRLGGTKPLSATKRAEKVKHEVKSAEIGLIKLDPKLHGGNSEWNDQQVVIVATYLPTGEFQVNAVVKHDSAVNAALAVVARSRPSCVLMPLLQLPPRRRPLKTPKLRQTTLPSCRSMKRTRPLKKLQHGSPPLKPNVPSSSVWPISRLTSSL